MAFVLPEEKPHELPPPGVHTAVCIKVVDLGTQTGKFGPKHQLYIQWELPDERASDGRPFVLGRFYNYSSNPKATLRQDIQGWLGRTLTAADFGKFDLSRLVTTTCTLGIQHQEREGVPRANIGSVLKASKGCPARLSPSNPTAVLSLDDRPFDYSCYGSLPDWLKELIARSPEYQRATNGGVGPQARVADLLKETSTPEPPTAEDLDDEIPF
jgi:hypothetical protein